MTGRSYAIYDVFTAQKLAGNPLAVVFDGENLTDAAMQAVAREFNLSETTFLSRPRASLHRAAVRIFTPDHELPFAGHPTVGTAIALSERDGLDAQILVLEEKVGPVRCAVSAREGGIFAEFDLPKLPQPLSLEATPELIGAALGLGPHEIGFENHTVGLWSAGVPYVTVPVADLAAAARVRLNKSAWLDLAPRDPGGNAACPYVYCRQTVHHDSAFHARMIVPGANVWEDPATGSAAAAFAGAIVAFDAPLDGNPVFWIEQGIEMARPSRIRLEIDVVGSKIAGAKIGGHAVKVAEGTLLI